MDSVSPFLSGDKAQPKGMCGSMAGSTGRCAIIGEIMIWIAAFPKHNLGNIQALHHPLSKFDFQFAIRFSHSSKSKIVQVVVQVVVFRWVCHFFHILFLVAFVMKVASMLHVRWLYWKDDTFKTLLLAILEW